MQSVERRLGRERGEGGFAEANRRRRRAAASARGVFAVPRGKASSGTTKMGSCATIEANVPGRRASARSIAWPPREWPTPTHRPRTPSAPTTARTSSANRSQRSASSRERAVDARGAVEPPCARMSKVTTRAGRPWRTSASTRGSNTRPWNPFACARRYTTGASRSTPAPPGADEETARSWTSRTTPSVEGTWRTRMAPETRRRASEGRARRRRACASLCADHGSLYFFLGRREKSRAEARPPFSRSWAH